MVGLGVLVIVAGGRGVFVGPGVNVFDGVKVGRGVFDGAGVFDGNGLGSWKIVTRPPLLPPPSSPGCGQPIWNQLPFRSEGRIPNAVSGGEFAGPNLIHRLVVEFGGKL